MAEVHLVDVLAGGHHDVVASACGGIVVDCFLMPGVFLVVALFEFEDRIM